MDESELFVKKKIFYEKKQISLSAVCQKILATGGISIKPLGSE
jgi:hypothetical protein